MMDYDNEPLPLPYVASEVEPDLILSTGDYECGGLPVCKVPTRRIFRFDKRGIKTRDFIIEACNNYQRLRDTLTLIGANSIDPNSRKLAKDALEVKNEVK